MDVRAFGVDHLDLVLEVLLCGQQVPYLLVIDLQERGLQNLIERREMASGKIRVANPVHFSAGSGS